jgi:hypothetical protein
MNTCNNTDSKDKSFVVKSATEYLWDEVTSLYCDCAHPLPDHSRNDDPRRGHCVVRGCTCIYFTPYRVRTPKKKKEWEGSW